jgi:hypothetical protein
MCGASINTVIKLLVDAGTACSRFQDQMMYGLFAMLVKTYGTEAIGPGRYSPPVCTGAVARPVRGNPDPDHISTSYVERQNLTMRMRMRRFTRLTNAFSKKLENLGHAIALHFMHYNFVRRHMSLSVTPAMAAGITRKLWSLEDVVRLID